VKKGKRSLSFIKFALHERNQSFKSSLPSNHSLGYCHCFYYILRSTSDFQNTSVLTSGCWDKNSSGEERKKNTTARIQILSGDLPRFLGIVDSSGLSRPEKIPLTYRRQDIPH